MNAITLLAQPSVACLLCRALNRRLFLVMPGVTFGIFASERSASISLPTNPSVVSLITKQIAWRALSSNLSILGICLLALRLHPHINKVTVYLAVAVHPNPFRHAFVDPPGLITKILLAIA